VRLVLVILVGIASAVSLGLWSAWLTVRSPAPIDTIELGAWQAWPNAGTDAADPYSRARLARTGEIPLGSGEGLALLALTDDSGEPLTAACDYKIVGQTPPARLWTMALEAPDGRFIKSRAGVSALGSDTLLRDSDGSFEIVLSAHPRTGNWLSTEDAAHFRIIVRLYDTTARTGTELTTLFMPRVTREQCT
jgi:hypothetical protein